MSSDDILPWHSPLLEHCERLISRQRMPHALLVRGRDGDGLMQAVQSLVALCLCETPVGAHACGECKACGLVAAGTHPDLIRLLPEEKGRMIKVDAVRELVNQFSHTPQIGRWKIAIVHPATSMNHAAANALIKTLEEPSGQALLILTADRHAWLLPTIQSRCQVMMLPRPTQVQAEQWLARQGIAGQAATDLLEATSAAPLLAREWHEEDKLATWHEFQRVFSLVADGRLTLAGAADTLKDLSVEDIIRWYAGILAERLKQNIHNPLASRGLLACQDQLLEVAREQRRGTNPNPQLLLENLLMQWQRTELIINKISA